MTRECTCLGTCRGADGLGTGWRCALKSDIATVPTPGDIAAAPPEQRRAMVRAFTAPLFAKIERVDAERAAANLCRERDCTRPPCGVEPLPEWCAECARETELEWLTGEQEEERHG